MAEYFRADKRSFSAGQDIETAGEFVALHPDAGRRTEQVLSERRPKHKPERITCLMLFEDEEDARNFCCKMSEGKLYAVDVPDEQILHIGDMSLVDEIARQIRDGGGGFEKLADAYWRGEKHDPSCMEILDHNPRVGGSSPSPATIFLSKINVL
jgi:hypothetical protein